LEKWFSLAFFLFSISSQTNGQTADSNSVNGNSYIYLNTSYNTNNSTGSKSQVINAASANFELSYYHQSGFSVSVLPNIYAKTDQFSYDMDGSIGYLHSFNPGFDISLNYQYHYYQGDTLFKGIDYHHLFDFTAGYSLYGFYPYIDFYEVASNPVNYFGTAGLGYFKDWDLFGSDAWDLSVFPSISAAFGTDYWLYSNLTLREKRSTIYNLNKQGYNAEVFDYQSLDMILPITLTHKSISLGVSCLLSLSADKYKALEIENQSGFLFSLDYTFDLK
jgi:hypothetical protein